MKLLIRSSRKRLCGGAALLACLAIFTLMMAQQASALDVPQDMPSAPPSVADHSVTAFGLGPMRVHFASEFLFVGFITDSEFGEIVLEESNDLILWQDCPMELTSVSDVIRSMPPPPPPPIEFVECIDRQPGENIRVVPLPLANSGARFYRAVLKSPPSGEAAGLQAVPSR